MGQRINELSIGQELTMILTTQSSNIRIPISITNFINEDIATIKLHTENTPIHTVAQKQVLNFSNVNIKIEYSSEEGLPYMWSIAKVVYYKNHYVLQVKGESTKFNRRQSFRVGISHVGKFEPHGGPSADVMIRDISLSGFSVTDRKKAVFLSPGVHCKIKLKDLDYDITCFGRLVRQEERSDGGIIYGFAMTDCSKDLGAYINEKQRQHRFRSTKKLNPTTIRSGVSFYYFNFELR